VKNTSLAVYLIPKTHNQASYPQVYPQMCIQISRLLFRTKNRPKTGFPHYPQLLIMMLIK